LRRKEGRKKESKRTVGVGRRGVKTIKVAVRKRKNGRRNKSLI